MVNYLGKMVKSITDKNFGEEIKIEKLSAAFKYFFVLILILGSITAAKFTLDLDKIVKESISDIKSEVGNFELKKGNFIYYGEMPFIKTDGETAVVIDTTGVTNEDVLKSYTSGVFISEKKLIFKKNKIENTTYNFEDFKENDFTKKQLIEIMEKMNLPLIITIFILSIIFLFFWKAAGVIIVSIMALIASIGMKIKLNYTEIIKITIYSITLPSILKTVFYISNTGIPMFFSIYYGVILFYMIRYIKSYKNKESENI